MKNRCSILIITLIMLCAVIITGCSTNETPTKVETPSIEVETPVEEEVPSISEEPTVFYVGDTAKLNGITASLVGFNESNGSPYNRPNDGNIFVLCEFEIANNSDEEIIISSMLSFDAYCDDYACAYSLGALLEKDNKNQLDGTIAAGKKMNGVIGYEVPINWNEIEISFTPEVWYGNDITFVAVNDREI